MRRVFSNYGSKHQVLPSNGCATSNTGSIGRHSTLQRPYLNRLAGYKRKGNKVAILEPRLRQLESNACIRSLLKLLNEESGLIKKVLGGLPP